MLWLAAYLTDSTCRIARPSLDARSGTNVVGLIHHFYQLFLDQTARRPMSCQCPLGLIPHFYDEFEKLGYKVTVVCQCPLGLIPHFYIAIVFQKNSPTITVSMPSRAYTSFLPEFTIMRLLGYQKCQCPLGLIPHFYSTPSKT